MDPQLSSFVNQARASGQSDAQISSTLAQNGWSQQQIDEALGTSQVTGGVVAPIAPAPQQVQSAGPSGNFLDEKTKQTIIWSVVGYFVMELISAIATALVVYLVVPRAINIYGISVPVARPGFSLNIISIVINSVIGGAIAGIILAKLYGKIQDLSNRFLGGKLNTLYRVIFYPAVIGGILSLFMAGGLSFSVFGNNSVGNYFFVSLVVGIAATLIGSYIYAKLMQKKVGQYY